MRRLADRLGYSRRDAEMVDLFIDLGLPYLQTGRLWPRLVTETAAELQLPELIGNPTVVTGVEYRNPIVVELAGSGSSLLGVGLALRMVRDWSNKRRKDSAAADEAEAAARERAAKADQAESRADCTRWLVDELKAGRLPISPSEILGTTGSEDLDVLDRLAQNPIQLELPPGLDAPDHDDQETPEE